jgi:transcriptional regulator with XRE-family HTH domain
MKEIIERIKALRNIRGYSYENMAAGLNISVSAYRKIEKNETNLTVERLFEIAHFLKVPVNQLLDIDGFSTLQQKVTDTEIIYARLSQGNHHPINHSTLHNRILFLEDQVRFLLHEIKLIQSKFSD